ncbi:MAG: hypothetical protein JOZ24_02490 [Candidatus Eremiobacteraeota bacterium]|nr:hypothetical protein [Candidatus Eremiobacteraeota bacterium]
MALTFAQGPTLGGVTFAQCAPPSDVRQINPSSVPAQIVRASRGERPSA